VIGNRGCRDGATRRRCHAHVNDRSDPCIWGVVVGVGGLVDDLVQGSELVDREVGEVHVLPLRRLRRTLVGILRLSEHTDDGGMKVVCRHNEGDTKLVVVNVGR
jgi:hypothetical protein